MSSVGVGVGGQRRTRRTHKERNNDTVRHDKETDPYDKETDPYDKETDRYVSGDHNYLFFGEDQPQ